MHYIAYTDNRIESNYTIAFQNEMNNDIVNNELEERANVKNKSKLQYVIFFIVLFLMYVVPVFQIIVGIIYMSVENCDLMGNLTTPIWFVGNGVSHFIMITYIVAMIIIQNIQNSKNEPFEWNKYAKFMNCLKCPIIILILMTFWWFLLGIISYMNNYLCDNTYVKNILRISVFLSYPNYLLTIWLADK